MNVRLFHSFIYGTDYGKATSFPQGESNTRAFSSSRLVIFTQVTTPSLLSPYLWNGFSDFLLSSRKHDCLVPRVRIR